MPYILIIWMANTNPVTIATYPTEDREKAAVRFVPRQMFIS